MTKSYFRVHIEDSLQEVVNKVSLASAIITIFLIIGLGYLRPHIFNRVSLRFQAFIAIIDVIRHILYDNIIHDAGPLCTFLSFFKCFMDHLYLFANVVIVINVQMLYFNNKPPQKKIEILLIIIAILTAAVINAIPFAFDFYGRSFYGVCFIRDGAIDQIFFKIILIYVVQSLALIYCFFVFMAIFLFLKLRKSYIQNKIPDKTIILFGETVSARKFINKLYFRMALYPMTSFICFFPYIAANIYYDITKNFPDWMYVSLRFGLRFTGTLNLIALLFDPHFQLAIINIRKNELFYSQVDRKELNPDIDLKTIKDLKAEEECLIDYPGQESIKFEEFIKFV